jgi:hypothetical protein
LIPTTPANRRDVEKWTLFDPDLLQIRIQTSKKLIAKAGSDSSGKFQVLALFIHPTFQEYFATRSEPL